MTEKEKAIDEFVENLVKIDTRKEYFEKVSKKIKKDFRYLFIEKYEEKDIICCYCKTDIRVIQKLIKERILNPRRCNTGFRGIHLEVEHMDGDNTNHERENISFCCYFCNNDKSNNIDHETFEVYFGEQRGIAFKNLYDSKINKDSMLSYYFHNKPKKST